ncbi:MATE family efflux transporter [Aegicerativicinus sediminis]|uniref:MATE family efflux transporter n=1 Tax=Aegicerativicinus sediminis TaxID=2893202 RepID=UPI001E4759F2|nr:MATE family efflux transporter [Aegicerativicinus sediminis]
MKSELSFKAINKLAIPALISGISEPILSLTDTAIIGNIDTNATESLAAVGIVGTFLSMLIWVFGQTRSAISSIISQHLGAGKLERVENLPAQAILIITSLSFLIILITYPFAQEIFKLYNADNLILEYSIDYYRIRVFGLPFTLFTITVFGAFRGLQNTFHPMIIAIVGALTNVILDFILVFGLSDLIPALGLKGAAYASVAAQVLMAIISAIYIVRKTSIPLMVKLPWNEKIPDFLLMIANLFVRTVALNVTLYFASSFATKYGKEYIAAYTIAINLWFFGAFLIDGFASAGNIMSGKLLGAKRYKEMILLSNRLIIYGIIAGAILSISGLILYNEIPTIFTQDQSVIQQFKNVFWLVLLMQPFCAVAFIFDGIFKGLGKMKYLRNLLLISTFLVFLPILLLLDHWQLQLKAIFVAITFWVIARGIPLVIKFRSLYLPLAKSQP